METPRLDRDLGGRADGAGRVFTRGQLDAELAKVEASRLSRMSRSEIGAELERRRGSPFASSPAVEEQELSPRFKAELAKHEESQRLDAEHARRLGNE